MPSLPQPAGTDVAVLADRRADLLRRLGDDGPPLILDGAMGTELQRRGVATPLPLWSAPANVEQAAIVKRIHSDYVHAGAELISTNSFRTTLYALERAGVASLWPTWTRRAVELARQAAGARAWVLGAVTTLEDCYRPDLVPGMATLRHYHGRQIERLVELGVDGILLETFNSLRELSVAGEAAHTYDLPVFVAVIPRADGRLYDGTPLRDVLNWIREAPPAALLINCGSPEVTDQALRQLLPHAEPPLGAYANVGKPGGESGFTFTHAYAPTTYARWVIRWTQMGLRIVGGCCGTTPDYIRAVARVVGASNPPCSPFINGGAVDSKKTGAEAPACFSSGE